MEEFFWIMVGLAVIGTIFLLYKVCIKDYNGTSNTNNASTKKQSIDVGFVQRIEITTNLQKAKFLAEKIGKISFRSPFDHSPFMSHGKSHGNAWGSFPERNLS